MIKLEPFGLSKFDEKKILQRPFFKDFHFDADKSDEEILQSLSYANADSQESLEKNFDIFSKLIYRIADYLKLIKRHIDRLERYRRAVADKIVEDKTANIEKLREQYEREQRFVQYYQLEIYWDVETFLRDKAEKSFRELDEEIKLLHRKFFAERLKMARQAARLTQADFGASVGLSQRAISNYEQAIREPTLATIVRFSKKLKRPINWFFE